MSTIVNKRFRNKRTGEIVTQFRLLDIGNFEEIENDPIIHGYHEIMEKVKRKR